MFRLLGAVALGLTIWGSGRRILQRNCVRRRGSGGFSHTLTGTVQNSTVQYSTIQYSRIQYTIQYYMIQDSAIQYSTVQYKVQFDTEKICVLQIVSV